MKFGTLLIHKIIVYSLNTFIVLLAFSGIMLAAGDGNAQENESVRDVQLDINFQNDNLISVFNKITEETGFKFIYNKKDIKDPVKFNKQYTKESLYNVLLDISEESKLRFRQVNSNISVQKRQGANPQEAVTVILNVDISGNITDESGEGLPGASVLEKGTNNGTVSDLDGNYKLTVTEGSIVVFSYVGYETTEVTIGDRAVIDVAMELSATDLSEIIVTALGVERDQKGLGYSVTKLDNKAINEVRETNIVNSLQGAVAGVQVNPSANGVGSSSRVIIRGNSSFNGNNQPLYVVDGVPILSGSSDVEYSDEFGGAASFDYGNEQGVNLNPDDIESVSVLKGPSAAALYGSRAANGVILITTKKGSKNDGLGITLNSQVTFKKPYIFPEYQDRYGAGRGGHIQGKRWHSDPDQAYYDAVEQLDINRVGDDKSWGGPLDGTMHRTWDSYYTIKPYDAAPDFAENFYETGVTNNHSIAIDGGSENTQARVSIGRVDDKGIVPTSKLERTTVNLRLSSTINEKLTIDGKITYAKEKVHNRVLSAGRGSIPWMINMMPRGIEDSFLADYLNPAFVPGSWPPGAGITPFIISRENRNPAKDPGSGSGESALFQPLGPKAPWVGNPYWYLNRHTNDDERNKYTGLISLRYKITDDLSAQVRLGQDQSNFFATIKKGAGALRDSFFGYYSENTIISSELNADFLISYNKEINENFTVTGNVGGNHLRNAWRQTSVSASEFITDDFFAIDNFEQVSPGNSYREEFEVNSLYFSGQLGYRNIAFLDVTGRNDWSSTLPAENRSFFYPSVAGSFVFSDAFNISNQFLSFGKIRASWAEVGNGTTPYALQAGLTTGRFGGQLMTRLDNNIPLADLKPEITRSVELGTDLRFFDGKVNLDFTWYKADTRNQIVNVGVPRSTGYETRTVNAGSIENKGIELLLSGTPIDNPNFSWDVSLNYTKNQSEVTEVLSDENVDFLVIRSVDLSGGNQVTFRAEKGQPYGVIYGRKYLRNSDGNVVVNSNGVPLGTDQQLIGDANPDWMAGLNNRFRYKNFEMGFLIDIRKGGVIINNTARTMNRAGTHVRSLNGRDEYYASPEFMALTSGSERSSDNGNTTGGVDLWTSGNAVIQDDALPKDVNGNQIGGEINNFFASPRKYHESIFKQGIVEPFVEDAGFVKLRQFAFTYNLPQTVLETLPFTRASVSFIGRNLLIFHRSTDDFDPEANLSSGNGQGIEGNSLPGTGSYGFNIILGL